MIQFDLARCVGCGMCVGDCFPGAISIEAQKAVLSAPENCIGCGHCIAICPCAAVSDDSLSMEDIHPMQRDMDPNVLLGAMRSRRSCRHYTGQSVDAEMWIRDRYGIAKTPETSPCREM